jgi:hypothetical protein
LIGILNPKSGGLKATALGELSTAPPPRCCSTARRRPRCPSSSSHPEKNLRLLTEGEALDERRHTIG